MQEPKQYTSSRYVREANGKTHFDIKCPFCGEVVTAYLWSLSGGGKKCPCGAMHSAHGLTFPKTEKPNKKP